LITGSGLGKLAGAVRNADVIRYAEIPLFPVSTVEGHSGQLVLGELGGQAVVMMQGRVHFYEGYSMQQVTFPVRVMRALGVSSLIITNAAGGMNESFRPGDLMLIADHINLVGMAGWSPLRGPNDMSLGPRFPEMSQVYSTALRDRAKRAAAKLGFSLQEGVYVMVAGPSFETPAELQFLRSIGADAVGMSTAPEATVARHAGMEVLGISLISNLVVYHPTGSAEVESLHDEVLAAGEEAAPRLIALITRLLENWSEGQS
jgi:purine-nucleoside phosphorylase